MLSDVDRIVINTGPLVTLGRAGVLHVIGSLPFAFLAPSEVAEEIEIGQRQGHPVELPSWVGVLPLVAPPNPISAAMVDRG